MHALTKKVLTTVVHAKRNKRVWGENGTRKQKALNVIRSPFLNIFLSKTWDLVTCPLFHVISNDNKIVGQGIYFLTILILSVMIRHLFNFSLTTEQKCAQNLVRRSLLAWLAEIRMNSTQCRWARVILHKPGGFRFVKITSDHPYKIFCFSLPQRPSLWEKLKLLIVFFPFHYISVWFLSHC